MPAQPSGQQLVSRWWQQKLQAYSLAPPRTATSSRCLACAGEAARAAAAAFAEDRLAAVAHLLAGCTGVHDSIAGLEHGLPIHLPEVCPWPASATLPAGPARCRLPHA